MDDIEAEIRLLKIENKSLLQKIKSNQRKIRKLEILSMETYPEDFNEFDVFVIPKRILESFLESIQ